MLLESTEGKSREPCDDLESVMWVLLSVLLRKYRYWSSTDRVAANMVNPIFAPYTQFSTATMGELVGGSGKMQFLLHIFNWDAYPSLSQLQLIRNLPSPFQSLFFKLVDVFQALSLPRCIVSQFRRLCNVEQAMKVPEIAYSKVKEHFEAALSQAGWLDVDYDRSHPPNQANGTMVVKHEMRTHSHFQKVVAPVKRFRTAPTFPTSSRRSVLNVSPDEDEMPIKRR
jgi:hypothetical protein